MRARDSISEALVGQKSRSIFQRNIIDFEIRLIRFPERMAGMWANNVKPKNPSGMWHRRALLIDTRKTTLVIETENTNSENPQSVADKSQLNLAVPEYLLTVADLTEEPQKESTGLRWLTQAFSPIYDLLG